VPEAPRRHRPEDHKSNRAGWLRAAVLGANDGIVSTAALIVGMAGADASSSTVRTAGIAGLVAGALSMAAGEYVSVSAQRDAERADLQLERRELREHPQAELAELTGIWRDRGLEPELAAEVARQLTAADALGAHARDELGLTEQALARPIQAALTSAIAFAVGALVPLLTFVVWTVTGRIPAVMAVATATLAGSGTFGAAMGGAPRFRAATRVVVGGLLAMVLTLGIGEATGAVLG
jgi:VIT1/CCC1 family predicted Fe2+/Mn2+ transporter